MIADVLDVVIGVDTHKDTHTYAVVRRVSGVVVEVFSARAHAAGYREACARVAAVAPGERTWGIEGTGSYGAGLTRHLGGAGERVVEVDHPHKRNNDPRGKSDERDAIRAAQSTIGRLRLSTPRAQGPREALRVLLVTRSGAMGVYTDALRQLRSLIVTAPDALREKLDVVGAKTLLRTVIALRAPRHDPERAAVVGALRAIATRARAASAEADEHQRAITWWVTRIAPELLAARGVGPISAAQILVSWSHPGRLRSEACFARLAGVAPIPASSGKTIRHRLDRGGDRALNSSLHTIALTRARIDPATIAYIARRIGEGKTRREAIRVLKRHIARGLYRLVMATATPVSRPE